jgi:hypothetical protein
MMAGDQQQSVERSYAAATLVKLAQGYQVSQALHVAAKLRIADLLRERPRSAEELARATGAHVSSLHRLLRALASLGVFTEDRGCFRLTPMAEPLQTGVRGSVHAAVTWYGEPWNWLPWGNLLHSVQTGGTAFEQVYGIGYYDYLGRDRAAAGVFNEAMASSTAAGAVADAYDFTGIGRLVDVGGGHGQLLAAVLLANPAMRGILLDLPHVVDGAKRTLEAAGVADRCEVVGGDFLTAVPSGGEAYVLKSVLVDWDDERAVRILSNCRRVLGPRGTLLVVGQLLPDGNEPSSSKFVDLFMLVLTGGRVRTQAECGALLAAAGFELTRIIPTASKFSLIEGRPV